jgi:HK97 family phage portal protein
MPNDASNSPTWRQRLGNWLLGRNDTPKPLVNTENIELQSVRFTETIPTRSGGKGAATGITNEKATSEGYNPHILARRSVDRRAFALGMMERGMQRNDGLEWKDVLPKDLPIEAIELLTLLRRPINIQRPQASGRWQQAWGSQHTDCAGNWIRFLVRGGFERNRLGRKKIQEIWTIDPDRFEPVVPKEGQTWSERYVARERTLKQKYPNGIDADDVLHYLLQNPVNPFWGLSRIQTASVQIDTGVEGPLFGLSQARRGARPSAIMTVEGMGQNNYQPWRDRIDEQMAGKQNAGKVLLMPPGAKMEPWGFSNQDMDWLNGIKHADELVPSIFGVPIQILVPRQTKFDDLEVAIWMMHNETVIPEATQVVESENMQLLPEFLDPAVWRMVPVFNDSQVHAIDNRRQSEAFSRLVTATVPPEEASRALNMGLKEYPDWAVPLVSSSMIPLSEVTSGGVDTGQEP